MSQVESAFCTPQIRLDDPAKYQSIVDAEWGIIYQKLDNIAASGAKVVLSRLAIGDLATQYFADRDIFCAGRVRISWRSSGPHSVVPGFAAGSSMLVSWLAESCTAEMVTASSDDGREMQGIICNRAGQAAGDQSRSPTTEFNHGACRWRRRTCSEWRRRRGRRCRPRLTASAPPPSVPARSSRSSRCARHAPHSWLLHPCTHGASQHRACTLEFVTVAQPSYSAALSVG